MKIFFLCLLSLIVMSGCDNDDDKDENETLNPSGTAYYYKVTMDGTEQVALSTDAIYFDGTLELNGVFPNGAGAELGLAEIPPVGSYPSDISRSFAFASGTDAWFCNSGCTIAILSHDPSTQDIKVRVTGTLTNFAGNATRTLNSAEISAKYE